jgi:hypothetical protein
LFRQVCFAYQPCATAAAITDDTLLPFDLPAVRRKLTVDFEGGNRSPDTGLLLREAGARSMEL